MGLFTLYLFHILHSTHWKLQKKLCFFALNLQKNSKELKHMRKICYIYQIFTISIVFATFLVIALQFEEFLSENIYWDDLFNMNCFNCPSSENVITLLLSLRNIITKCRITDLWVSFLQSFKMLCHILVDSTISDEKYAVILLIVLL